MPTPHLVDVHCHVDLFDKPHKIVRSCEENGIYTIAVTNAPFVFQNTVELTSGCKFVRPAVGLHPELVHSHSAQLPFLKDLIKETRYIGEIGLDYSGDSKSLQSKQRSILTTILDWCAEEKNKIISLHSRRAANDVIKAVGIDYPGKVIFHWFTGSRRELLVAISSGHYFSLNGTMLNSTKGRQLAKEIPLDKILTESDGPFAKIDNQILSPESVLDTLRKLADLLNLPLEIVRAQVFSNFKSLLGNGT